MRGAMSVRLIYSQHLLCGRANWPSPTHSTRQPSTPTDPNILESSASPSEKKPAHRKYSNFICKTLSESFHRYPIEFRLRCELMMQWVIPHAVSIEEFLLTFWPWVIAVQPTRHFCIIHRSQVGSYGQRVSDVWQIIADSQATIPGITWSGWLTSAKIMLLKSVDAIFVCRLSAMILTGDSKTANSILNWQNELGKRSTLVFVIYYFSLFVFFSIFISFLKFFQDILQIITLQFLMLGHVTNAKVICEVWLLFLISQGNSWTSPT